MRITKKSWFIIALLAILLVILALILPGGIRAAVVNNLWSISFVKDHIAERLTSQQLSTQPDTHAHAGILQARLAMANGDNQQALRLLENVTFINDPVFLETYAELLFLKQRYPEALEIWKNLGRYNKIEHAARSLNNNNDVDMEILAWRKAFEIRPDIYTRILIYAELSKANNLRDSGNFSEAIPQYLSLIDEFPYDVEAYSELSWAYWLQGQSDLAVTTITKAMEIPSTNVQFYLRAGEIFEQCGQIEKALDAYQNVLRIDPKRESALQAIERLKKPN